MEDSWIIDNLENAFAAWNEKLTEMWALLTESPETFKDGAIWLIFLMEYEIIEKGKMHL